MATLYEYYNTGDDSFDVCYLANWRAQTFTPLTAHKITNVKLLLYRIGSPGTVTVGIRATDGNGQPTGADLCSGTTNGNTLTTSTAGEWREITLGAGTDLSVNTKYAIVVRVLGGDFDNKLAMRRDITSAAYTGGNLEWSNDSGSSWNTRATYDFMFEDWGEPLGVTHELAGVITGVASVSGLALITRGIAGLSAGVCTVSGHLPAIFKLAGTIVGVCSVSGATSILLKLAGVSSGICSTAGSLLNIKWLLGITRGVCSTVGSVLITRGLAGVSAGVSVVTASMINIKWLKGLIAGVATVSADLFHVRVAIRVLACVRNLLALRNIPPVR